MQSMERIKAVSESKSGTIAGRRMITRISAQQKSRQRHEMWTKRVEIKVVEGRSVSNYYCFQGKDK